MPRDDEGGGGPSREALFAPHPRQVVPNPNGGGRAADKPERQAQRQVAVRVPPDVEVYLDEWQEIEGDRRLTGIVVRALRMDRDVRRAMDAEWYEVEKLAKQGKKGPGEILGQLALEALEVREAKAQEKRDAARLLEKK